MTVPGKKLLEERWLEEARRVDSGWIPREPGDWTQRLGISASEKVRGCAGQFLMKKSSGELQLAVVR